MLSLKRIIKNSEEAGALNAQVNLYGFLDEEVFLTKSGDLGVILEVRGVDYEGLDGASVDALTKRLESALRLFDENYRVYQYLFKRNDPKIPHKLYGTPVVDAAIANRVAYLRSKSSQLFSLSIYYVVLFEASQPLGKNVLAARRDPKVVLEQVRAWFSTEARIVLLNRELIKARSMLLQKVGGFLLQVADFLAIRLLDKQDAFQFLTQILNFAPEKIECSRLKHDTFPEFNFLFLARTASHFSKANELFRDLVTIPLESNPADDLLRYFRIRKAWDLAQYASVTEGDLVFRNLAKERFRDTRFEHFYRAWKIGRVSDTEIREDVRGSDQPHVVHFDTQILKAITGLESEREENR